MRLSAIILSGLLTAGLVSASVDPGLLALVPADSQLVSGVHVDQSRMSPFGQFVISQIQTHPGDLQKLIDATGFDPRKDVAEVLMASNGQPQSASGLVLARGNFNPAKVEATATAKGATIQNYLGTDLIIGSNNGNNPKAAPGSGQTGAVAFLDNTLAVAGTVDAVKAVITNKGNTTPQLPQTVLAQISTLSSLNDAWFVSLVPGTTLMPQAAMTGGTSNSTPNSANPQASALQAILQSSGGVHFGDQISLSFQALTRSDKDAQSLSDVVRFIGSMVQMKRQENPQLGVIATAFDGMNLNTNGSTMTLGMSIPEQSFEQLAQSAKHGTAAINKP
jgi:hypothetical protein